MLKWFGAAAALALVAGCTGGARDVDYTQERGISADIAASHFQGSGSLYPGMAATGESGEPLGLIPWQLGERHD